MAEADQGTPVAPSMANLLTDALHNFESQPEYSEEASWMRLTEMLLMFCRRHQPAVEAWDCLPPGLLQSVVVGIEAEVAQLLSDGPISRFPADGQLAAVGAVAKGELTRPPTGDAHLYPLLVARGIAGGIDAVLGDTFIDWFRSRIEHTIKQDEAYVTAVHDPRLVVGDQPVNSRAAMTPARSLDTVPHLRLGGTASARYRFTLDFDVYFHLAPLVGENDGVRLAAAQPNLALDEFDVEWTEGPPRTFRNRGAKDPARQAELVIAAVERSAAAGATVVVVPEYGLAGAQRAQVAAAIDTMDPRPALVIGGSCEVPDPAAGGNRNEAWIYVPDDEGLSFGREIELPDVEQTSLVETDDRTAGTAARTNAASKVYPATVDGYVEAVVAAQEVPIFFTEAVTFAVLICRDAMSNELIDAMVDLGVNLLLVPAFSPKTGTIIGNSAAPATRSQALVVVACAPAFWADHGDEHSDRDGSDRAEAAFIGPYEAQPGPHICPSLDAPVAGRGTWVFDTASRIITWASIQ